MTEWISVQDRLPEKYVSVLLVVTDDTNIPYHPLRTSIMTGNLRNDAKWNTDMTGMPFAEFAKITHWMPLPLAPEKLE